MEWSYLPRSPTSDIHNYIASAQMFIGRTEDTDAGGQDRTLLESSFDELYRGAQNTREEQQFIAADRMRMRNTGYVLYCTNDSHKKGRFWSMQV